MSENNSKHPEKEVDKTDEQEAPTNNIDGDGNSKSKIVVTIEDGKMVFKKPQESLDEILFYNTDYFARIGFPDAEVSVGEMSPDGTMKGGKYKEVDKLTFPFRHFAFFIQPDGNDNENTHPINTDYNNTQMLSTNTPGLLERLGKYNADASNYFKNSMQKIASYFKQTQVSGTNAKKPTENVNENKLTIDASQNDIGVFPEEPSPNEQIRVAVQSVEENKSVPPAPLESNIPTKYWIVKIPILNDDEIVPKGKYEKAEEKLKVCRLISKVDESVKAKKVGVMYEVGSRMVIICERVQERVHNGSASEASVVAHNGSESIEIVPEGSLMSKMKKVKKGGCINE